MIDSLSSTLGVILICCFLLVSFISSVLYLFDNYLRMLLPESLKNKLDLQTTGKLISVLTKLGLIDELQVAKNYLRLKSVKSRVPRNGTPLSTQQIVSSYTSQGEFSLGKLYGEPSNIFIDLKSAMSDARSRIVLVDNLTALIRKTAESQLGGSRLSEFDSVLIPKMGNCVLGYEVSRQLSVAFAFFRGENNPIIRDADRNPVNLFDGDIVSCQRPLIIDDCAFRGDTLKEIYEHACIIGLQPVGIFLVVMHPEKQPEFLQYFQEKGVPVHSLI